MANEAIPDILADRYASAAMKDIWSPRAKVVLEREFWIAVLKAQRELGLDVPPQAIEAYERVKDDVDLAAIRVREHVSRHDVKARIDEFCALAGHQHIHKGLTSRDLTENVEQLQIRRSLQLIRYKYLAAIAQLAGRVEEYREVVLTARTHNVPAQVTTVGKRLAMFGGEMLLALAVLDDILPRYPLRGLKGPVGTQLDLCTLFDGDLTKVRQLEQRIAAHLGFHDVLSEVGQVYPRSLDLEVVALLVQLASGPSSFAKTTRLMAGLDLMTEGFLASQVGSSAMPHKSNPRSCERINGLQAVLRGYLMMVADLSGDQWNEGDVSCSVVRRVALPGAMFAIDGVLETFITVVREMVFFGGVIRSECDRHLPFLATTTVLMEAVKRGRGREEAHEAIKEHALAAARELREGGEGQGNLVGRLAGDARVGLDRGELEALLSADQRFAGAALAQADAFVERVRGVVAAIPAVAEYVPSPIL